MVGLQRISMRLLLRHDRLSRFAPNSRQPGRAFTLLVVVWAALTMSTAAIAAEYPARPIRFIVPQAPGGASDINARLLVTELSKQMGQQIVVDNRPGASTIIGTEMVAKAAPDGYTIGYVNPGLALNYVVLARLPYDQDKDLQMVARLGFQPLLLGASPSLPVKSVKELIEYAKNNPGKLSYGSTGNGSILHLSMELFKLMTGTQMVHIPYKAAQQVITEMIGGHVHVMFDTLGSILVHVKAGRVHGLGVTSAMRSPAVPELPTISEAGVPGFEVITWGGVMVPAGVPKAIVAKLNAAINKALASPVLKEKFAAIGYEPVGGTPEQFDAFVKQEIAKWADVIKRSGVKVD